MAETPHSATEPLLNLDTLIERQCIAIDDVKYEIIHPDELSVIEQARFGKTGRKIEELQTTDLDDPKEQDKVDAQLAQLIEHTARKIVVDVPDEVWAKVSGSVHWAIVDLFTGLLTRQKMTVAGAMMKAGGDLDALFRTRPTGGKSSPASSASMEEPRKAGWLKRLLGWFGLS